MYGQHILSSGDKLSGINQVIIMVDNPVARESAEQGIYTYTIYIYIVLSPVRAPENTDMVSRDTCSAVPPRVSPFVDSLHPPS